METQAVDVADIEMSGEQGAAHGIDPFAFYPGVSSRIVGLGGDAPGHDPAYVFHTPYVRVAQGRAEFTIHFEGLTGKRGTLAARVHMLPLDRSAHARLLNSERITIARLSRQGGTITIGVEGFRGMSYAVLGSIFDDTDATATALTVTLDRPHDGSDESELLAGGGTNFGNNGLIPHSHLVSVESPSLARPVSQICTAGQLEEQPFREWRARLQSDGAPDRKLWEQVYVLQALRRYGLIQPGARGLGFATGSSPLPAVMAGLGVSIVATDIDGGEPDAGLDRLRRPQLCDDALFDANISFLPIDQQAIPADLAGFDFLWSTGAISRMESVPAAVKFVEDAMACLAPGGLAVHTLDLALGEHASAPDTSDGTTFRKHEIERLGLQLISRGQEVVQMRMDQSAPRDRRPVIRAQADDVTSFGLICRRAPS